MSEHKNSKEEAKPETNPLDLRQWMDCSAKALDRVQEFWFKSADAGRDASSIVEKHIERMTERLNLLRQEQASTRELHREAAKHWAAMTEEILQADTVLRFYASSLDAFLDWRIAMQDSQENCLRSMGLPTRDEMTEIYRDLHDLRRKLDRVSKSEVSGGGSCDSGK